MFDRNNLITSVYLAASRADAEVWLAQGMGPAPATANLPLGMGRVSAWLAPEPVLTGTETVWLVAAVEPARVLVADWDLACGAAAAPLAEDARRLAEVYSRTATPLTDYRLGQFRRPQALVRGALDPITLARLPDVEPSAEQGAAYARQLYRSLRAMVGAPADAPLIALVAAVVARGRARLVAAYPDPDPIHLYVVDEGGWYFSLAAEFKAITALPEGGVGRIKG